MKLNGYTLQSAGFRPGPQFKKMLARANELFADDMALDDIFVVLHNEFPPAPPKIHMRENPAPLHVALDAATADEAANREAVIRQMNELLRVPVINRGAVMPDACPAGSAPCTIPVGGVIEVQNAIIPGAHSADICCSMYATFYETIPGVDLSTQLDTLQSVTRFGAGGRRDDDLVYHDVNRADVWRNKFLAGLERLALIHMADQGDGNHFAYLGTCVVTEELVHGLGEQAGGLRVGKSYNVIVTHHGSRGLGAQLYKRGLKTAVAHTNKVADNIPPSAAWLDASSEDGKEYWSALQYVGEWTRANHECIHGRFLRNLRGVAVASLYNAHNYVWQNGDLYYHGKGATPAGAGQIGLIPLNMTEPILIVSGAGNDQSLHFAPHGAGRNLSRSALIKSVEGDSTALHRGTRGVDVRWYSGVPDVSETSLAYKNADAVREQIKKYNLAQEIGSIEPYGCIMAGHFDKPWMKKNETCDDAKQNRYDNK